MIQWDKTYVKGLQASAARHQGGRTLILFGTIVNAVCILLGTLVGLLLTKIPVETKETVMKVIGLAVVVLGMQMAFASQQFLLVIMSLVVGAVLGEWWRLEDKLRRLGNWIERKTGTKKKEGNMAEGFVTATLIFVIGAMAIIGALDSGIRQDHSVLLTKSIIDGFTAMMLTTTLGVGVAFSAIPVFLYQGSIALFATQIDRYISAETMDLLIAEITATGGVLIIAIGLNLAQIVTIRVANLLPAILVVALLVIVGVSVLGTDVLIPS